VNIFLILIHSTSNRNPNPNPNPIPNPLKGGKSVKVGEKGGKGSALDPKRQQIMEKEAKEAKEKGVKDKGKPAVKSVLRHYHPLSGKFP
jgi:hypothetical protein